MAGETELSKLLSGLSPKLNKGAYVFATVVDVDSIDRKETVCEFKEREGTTIIIERKKADALNIKYGYIASWITLMVHSSLEAVGLTAVFSAELAKKGISCNVIAGYYHDHIFVDIKDTDAAMRALTDLSKS
jgi:hypothetical protein